MTTVKRLLSLVPLACCAWLAFVSPVAADDESVVTRARAAAASGQRPQAIAMLEDHLAGSPRDVDARLAYGLVLSWEGRYDESRRQLHQVLEQAPSYTDARVALMNVEWWSGRRQEARASADAILARDPGNLQARDVRDRLDAAARPWWAGVSYANDAFSDGREAWHETALSLTRMMPRGSLIVRASAAARFGRDDQLIEVEFYPRVRPGTYGFVSVGASPEASLYPSHRIAFDIYQALGRGVEVSAGVRRLSFASVTSVYIATASKYAGNWMLTGKVSHVPGEGVQDSTSYHAGFRRYVRGDGASYVGATYSHGFSREEIRNAADLTTLDSDSIRGEVDQRVAGRLRILVAAGTSRQEQQSRQPIWQTSISSGLMVLF